MNFLFPTYWKTKKLKFAFKILNGSTPSTSEPEYWDGDINWFTPDDLGSNSNKYIYESKRKISQEGYANCGVKIAPPDSIAISTRAPIGHIAILKQEGCVNQGCRLLVPQEEDSSYYYYLLLSLKEYMLSLGQGSTFFELSRQKLSAINLPFPPKTEQETIASFLDYKTKQIDDLIEKKEQLLKLLDEKRITLITQSVTKGLTPNVKMKPSGIEWLGNIPEHWNLWQLKRISQITYGIGGEIDKDITEGTRLLSLPNVTFQGNIKLDEEYYIELNDIEKKLYLLKKGDLLFNWRNGSSEHLAKTAIIDFDGEFTHVSFLLRLRFSENNDSRYFRYLLNSLRATGFFSSSKAGVNNTFNLTELSNLFLMIPSFDEQIAISDFLDNELNNIISLQKVILNAIDKLKEYRTSLIISAVTGKIDVRNFKLEKIKGETI